MTVGVYHISNIKTSDVFVGTSTDIERKLNYYITGLREQGKFIMFCSPLSYEHKLACDWREYGEQSFNWGILQEFPSRYMKSKYIAPYGHEWRKKLNATYNKQPNHIKISGVYHILNLVTKQAYIGESTDIITRWCTHRCHLSGGNHPSKKLQESWNKHGADKFKFEILEECLPENTVLLTLEKFWIKRTAKVFNVIV